MKITKLQLRKIIKEEIENTMEEGGGMVHGRPDIGIAGEKRITGKFPQWDERTWAMVYENDKRGRIHEEKFERIDRVLDHVHKSIRALEKKLTPSSHQGSEPISSKPKPYTGRPGWNKEE